ncbi:MAG: RNA-binding transcriptional accessory protein, partial [Chloroflexi bacterium]|nr:RNA-binding transcriptional accessory protein [Chloroflexota bacterium]
MAPDRLAERIAEELALPLHGIVRTIALLDDANTIPFIARYRKEATGGLNEVQIGAIEKRIGSLRALESRRAEVHRLIAEQGKMTPELAEAIAGAQTLQTLEDLYLPFRPKRRTRAMIARERGLEPLADLLLDQVMGNRAALAAPFVDAARDVPTVDDALAGARDIVAEVIAEDADVRGDLRTLFAASG